MKSPPQIPDGAFIYLLGLVVLASHPNRFWLGFGLATVPIAIGIVGNVLGGERWRQL